MFYDLFLTCLVTSHTNLFYNLSQRSASWLHIYLFRDLSHWPVLWPLTLTCFVTSHTDLFRDLSHWPVSWPLTLTCFVTSHTELSHWPVSWPLTLTCFVTSHTDLFHGPRQESAPVGSWQTSRETTMYSYAQDVGVSLNTCQSKVKMCQSNRYIPSLKKTHFNSTGDLGWKN